MNVFERTVRLELLDAKGRTVETVDLLTIVNDNSQSNTTTTATDALHQLLQRKGLQQKPPEQVAEIQAQRRAERAHAEQRYRERNAIYNQKRTRQQHVHERDQQQQRRQLRLGHKELKPYSAMNVPDAPGASSSSVVNQQQQVLLDEMSQQHQESMRYTLGTYLFNAVWLVLIGVLVCRKREPRLLREKTVSVGPSSSSSAMRMMRITTKDPSPPPPNLPDPLSSPKGK